ncbi:MAG: conjugal transfer protein TraF [Ignavibacteriota bacterium]|nr:hypothetical protein [Ignavibacteriota bacterium]
MKRLFLVILILWAVNLSAQFENTDVGARPTALGGAFTSLSDNSLAIFYNPAGLGQVKYREFSAYYSPAPFGLTDLSTASLSYSEPFSFGTVGAAFKTYGFDLYRENNFIVSYGNSYKKKIYYGANINLYNLHIENYNNATAFGLDIGAMVYLAKFLQWGFFGKNITGTKIGESKEKIAQVYRSGFTFQPEDKIRVIGEIEKDVKYPISVRGGLEYSVIDFLDLRFGVGSQPSIFSAGIGLNYNLFSFDYAFTKSEDLGFTHLGTISVNFGGLKAKKESRERLSKSFD